MYHPHFHIILMVNKSYFNNDYIKQSDWTNLWKESLKSDYTAVVHIQKFKLSNGKEVSEACKYTVKDNDYLLKNDLDLTDETVIVLDNALSHRRLIAFGGLLKKEHKKLNLSNIEDNNDLVHIDEDNNLVEELGFILERYNWNIGYSNYFKM